MKQMAKEVKKEKNIQKNNKYIYMYTYISRAWTSYKTEDKEEKSQTRKYTYVLLLPRNTTLRIKEIKRMRKERKIRRKRKRDRKEKQREREIRHRETTMKQLKN